MFELLLVGPKVERFFLWYWGKRAYTSPAGKLLPPPYVFALLVTKPLLTSWLSFLNQRGGGLGRILITLMF